MTDFYAVIGNPIGHTKSPAIHAAFAAATGQDIEYVAIEGKLGGFAADADAFRARGGRGLNVTAPFKLDAYRYAAALSGPAPFLHRAREEGVDVMADGVGMLVEQAAEAFALWRGVRPETADLIDELTVPLV